MGLGTCRSTLLSVSIYVIVAVAGAVVIMFMEREGMKRTANKDEQRPGNTSASPNNSKNLTMHAREYLENHASLSWSLDDTEKLIKEIKGFGSKSRQLAENDNHGWRKQLSLDTFSTWMYFAVCTTSTIGMHGFTVLFVYCQANYCYVLSIFDLDYAKQPACKVFSQTSVRFSCPFFKAELSSLI